MRWSAIALTLFCAQFALVDAAARGLQGYVTEPRAVASLAASSALLLLLAIAARNTAARIVVAASAAFALAFQGLFFAYFRAFVDGQVAQYTVRTWVEIRPTLVLQLPRLAIVWVLAFGLELLLLSRARTVPATSRRRVLAVLAIAVAGLGLGPRLGRATPELRLVDALGSLAQHERRARDLGTRTALPPLRSTRAAIPNVLFLITESVRADAYCSRYDPACVVSPRVNALLPERVPLSELRALDSYTFLSFAVLTTGRTQLQNTGELPAMPTLFDLLRAVRTGDDRAPKTAYLSAHNAAIVEQSDLRGAVDLSVTVEELLGTKELLDDADPRFGEVDRKVAELARDKLAALPSPFFVTLHFYGTHAPYAVDAANAPFQPWKREVTWGTLRELKNAYLDAIVKQDESVALAVDAFLARSATEPWAIVFTSDHGEEFGEHKQIHHGQDLYDEQLRVPGFIATSQRLLAPAEVRTLKENARGMTTHLDLLPTMLDLLGVLDSFALARERAKLEGDSLLRPRRAPSVLPLSNCTETFPCPFNNWGAMKGSYKLHAQAWDARFYCWNVASGREVFVEREGDECEELRAASKRLFPTLPNGQPNR